MNYTFFTNSEKAWKAMFEAISNAKESIYLEMYIFQTDIKKFDFYSLLKEKSTHGLKVKLILDSFGSITLSKNEIYQLRESGIELLFHSHLFHRGHRKVLITDESTAFIGGVNFHQIAQLWRDLVIMVKGSLVKKILKSFIQSYVDAGGTDSSLITKEFSSPLGKVSAWIIDHSPVKNIFSLKKIYKKHLYEAQERIILITPYFAPKLWLARALHQAVLRGVSVQVLVPRHTDQFLSDRVNYFYMSKLAKLGITFYLQSKMNHGKAMVIDQDQAMLGSQNLDFLSFDFNSETGIFFRDTAVVTKLVEITNVWKQDAIVFDSLIYKPKWFDYILSPIIKLFYKIM